MILSWLAERLDRTFNWFAPLSVLDVLHSEWADEMDEWELALWEEHHEVFEPNSDLPAAESPLVGGGTAPQTSPSAVPPTGMDIAQPRVHAGGLFNFFRSRG